MYEPTVVHFAEVARDKADALHRSPGGTFVGAMLAGSYIGIAMILALSVAAGLPAGARPLVTGAVFGIGLILTVFAGAELFTGYVMYLSFGLARHRITWSEAIRLIVVIWVGNLAGALILSSLFAAGGGGTIFTPPDYLHTYVAHKVDSSAIALLARAMLCNWLVCLALWTATRVEGDAAKCIVIGWLLLAFVGPGFEHSIANMTSLTLGLLVPGASIDLAGAIRNIVLVTAGNIVGGAVFVVGAYLATARTDAGGPPLHDAGPLPTALRVQRDGTGEAPAPAAPAAVRAS